jgi:hypothetical protein
MNRIQEEKTPRDDDRAMVARAKEYTEGVATHAGHAVDTASSAVGRGVDKAGAFMESTGKSAGGSVRSAGHYLQRANSATMRADLMATLGRHPGATLALGIGAGLLIGRLYRAPRS